MKKVLTIAGSDCSGGAGIQADLKTVCAHRFYGMSVITALTAQNTMGVTGIMEVSADFVGKQIDSIFTDIVPDAVKIGMVSSAEIIHVIAEKLKQYKPRAVVLDPVMISTAGSRLLDENAVQALCEELVPLCTVLTPNIPEAQVLYGKSVDNATEMEQAAKQIGGEQISVLVKGGHQINTADDVLYADGESHWYRAQRVDNTNTHGTGCTLSTAIACGLAQGLCLADAVAQAKKYLHGAICDGLDLGQGSGPLNHLYQL